MIGIQPPDDMPREAMAAWYWGEIEDEANWHGARPQSCPARECPKIQDLITGAIEAGVSAHSIPVIGFAQPQPFHSLVAPYRTTPGGLAEQQEATRREVLNRPAPRRFKWGDPA